jgi:threonine/homoserine/homoserine lactone efflux protein
LVSNAIHFFRRKKTDLELKWVNRISGVLITGFGLAILLSPLLC